MSYKPKYCCECGDRIERASWGFAASRRFCDLCETNFRHLDWIPKISLAAALFLTAVSIGFYFKRPEKSFALLNGQPPQISSNSNANNAASRAISGQTNNAANSRVLNVISNEASSKNENAAAKSVEKPSGKIESAENKLSRADIETVYFCGAQTKKGTPCTRRVKRAGRCWQHAGQPPLLPPEKLIAN